MNWSSLFSIIRKELQIILQDPRSRYVIIVPPLVQLFLFSFAATLDVKNVPIGIVNLDNGAKSIQLIERFQGSSFFSKIIFLPSVKEIDPFINTMKGPMVLVIDEQFSRLIESKRPAQIQLILDGRKSNTAQIIAGYTETILSQFAQEFDTDTNIVQNSILVPRNWFNENLIYHWYNVPSLSALLTLLIGMVLSACSISRERELGTLDQLLVSPASPLEIYIGKAIPAMLVCILEASLILLAGTVLLEVPFRGSFFLFYLNVIIFVFSIIGIGLFVSTIAKNQQQATLGSWIFMSPSILISGFATPIENMPQWLQTFTYIIPLRYHLFIAKGLFLKDIPYYVVWNNIWPMALIGCVTFTLGALIFSKKIE